MYDLEKDSILRFKVPSWLSASTALASIKSLSALILLNSRSWSSSDFLLNICSFRNSIFYLLSWCSSWCRSGWIVIYISWFCNVSTISTSEVLSATFPPIFSFIAWICSSNEWESLSSSSLSAIMVALALFSCIYSVDWSTS